MLNAAFGLPFKEQIDFFNQKLNLPSQHYDDILHGQHDRGYIVAGAMKADLVTDLREAVRAGIEDGETLADFRKRFGSIVKTRGWTGWTGEGTDEGVAWRTKVIYATNLRSSHAAGRWQQMTDPELMKARPYWRYRHTSNEHPRMQHKQWDGLVLPAGDDWFKSHYPPNGWGCKCRIETINERGLQKLGKSTPDKAPDDGTYQAKTRNGEMVELPNGIQYGWGYAPGATWHPDLNRYPHEIAKQVVAANMKEGVFDRYLNRVALQVKEDLKDPIYQQIDSLKLTTEGRDIKIKELLRQRLGTTEQYPVAVLTAEQQALLGVQTQVLYFSNYDAVKQAYSRDGNIGFDHAAYHLVQSLLDDAKLIVRQDGDRAMMTVWVEVAKGKNYMAVLQQTKTGKGLFLKSYRRSNPNDLARAKKNGVVLYERKD